MPSLPASAETLLRSACLPGQEWPEVQARIAENTVQVWLGERSAILTELVGDAIHVWLGAGDLNELLEMRPLIERYGREIGCTRATIDGRLGWDRALKTHGFKRVLEKIL